MVWGNKLRNLIILCIMLVLCVGCSRDTEEKEAATPAAEPTAKLSDSLDLQVEVHSLNQVNLSWNQVLNVARYVIVREELDNDDEEIPGLSVGETELAELPAEETSYQDTAAEAGKYYQYHIYAYSKNSMQAKKEDRWHFASDKGIVHVVVESVYWETTYLEFMATSPSSITMMACFNQNSTESLEPDVLEVYRGTSLDEMEKIAEVPASQENLINEYGHKGVCYVDENVEAGKAYYYEARAYAEIDGKKEYGSSSGYMRKSAVLPEGDYAMNVTQKKGKNPSLELSLQSKIKGNAELQFIENQFNGLVDYVYRKDNNAYESLSMSLDAYRKGNEKWVSYQGQPLCLEGEEKIDFRFVPLKSDKTFIPPEDSWKSAEVVLLVKYDSVKRDLHFDLKKNQAFITKKGDDEGSPEAVSSMVATYEINQKGSHQKASIPDVSIFLENDYGDILFSPVYTKKNRGNCPDGVEIYRSSDNKNFSLAGTVEYPEYGSARYNDSTIFPGDKWYYKARNYTDTGNDRIYGKFSTCSEPFYADYEGGKYKMWLVEDESAKKQDQIVLGFYSYSLGNPTLDFDYVLYYCYFGENDCSLKIKGYSLDGIHWKKKYRKFNLPAGKMVYLKMEMDKKQEGFTWENADRISFDTSLADATNWFVDFDYYMATGKMSCVASCDG